jgi:hypothetical protein
MPGSVEGDIEKIGRAMEKPARPVYGKPRLIEEDL